jgi:hypothetical protein
LQIRTNYRAAPKVNDGHSHGGHSAEGNESHNAQDQQFDMAGAKHAITLAFRLFSARATLA